MVKIQGWNGMEVLTPTRYKIAKIRTIEHTPASLGSKCDVDPVRFSVLDLLGCTGFGEFWLFCSQIIHNQSRGTLIGTRISKSSRPDTTENITFPQLRWRVVKCLINCCKMCSQLRAGTIHLKFHYLKENLPAL